MNFDFWCCFCLHAGKFAVETRSVFVSLSKTIRNDASQKWSIVRKNYQRDPLSLEDSARKLFFYLLIQSRRNVPQTLFPTIHVIKILAMEMEVQKSVHICVYICLFVCHDYSDKVGSLCYLPLTQAVII